MRFSAIESSFRSRIWSLSDPETDSSNVFPLIPHSTCNMRFNPNRSMGDIGVLYPIMKFGSDVATMVKVGVGADVKQGGDG
jgi:hypothetical protein